MNRNKTFVPKSANSTHANSALPKYAFDYFSTGLEDFVQNQPLYSGANASSSQFYIVQDDPGTTLVKQHWYIEIPIIERVYTGSERGRQWNDKQVGTDKIDYPDAFDNVLFEYAQGEADAAKKDEFAYAEWFMNVRQNYEWSIGDIASINTDSAPPSNISAAKAQEFKNRLLEILKGHPRAAVLRRHVNHIMIRTLNDARSVGVAIARTNPVVEEAMRNPTYRAWRLNAHRSW